MQLVYACLETGFCKVVFKMSNLMIILKDKMNANEVYTVRSNIVIIAYESLLGYSAVLLE
jgi:hypothetical protein